MKTIPTLRSHFNFEQFQKVLQKQAHRIAIDAVKNLDQGDVRIQIHGHRFSAFETSHITIRFYANHASYYEQPTKSYKDWWGFDVEEKLFMTSNHSTKISFANGDNKAETAAKKKKIEDFIEEMMSESGMQVISRFTLQSKKA